jgi:anti-repressor protein
MTELIAINYKNEKPTVSGRELHLALGVETRYNDWFIRMCEYGFIQGKDYYSILSNRSDGLPGKQRTDHQLSIPMAKEICMLQRSEKGKQFRQYFISVEEAWNDPDAVIDRAQAILRRRVEDAERRIFGLLEEKESLEIALNESLKFYTVAKYNKVFKQNWTMTECQRIGKQLYTQGGDTSFFLLLP